MRTLFVLVCSFALTSLALSAEQGKGKKKEEPKKQAAHAGQVSQPTGKGAGKPIGAGKPAEFRKSTVAGRPTGAGKPEKVGKATGAGRLDKVGKASGAGKAAGAGKPLTAGGTAATKVRPQHFNLANKPKPGVAPAVQFQQNRRIEGAQNWRGSNYTVFRNYSSQWHDRNWWGSHYSRVVFVLGGWYYWDAGWWYPAWGYDPGAYYPYDGPVYGYNDLPPDQVIANAQAALQQQGYYRGEVDGLLGPLTRAAVADYQRDHGLYITSAIDRPTLSSLGLT